MKNLKLFEEFVNERINADIVNRDINLLDKAADMAIKNPKGNVVELAKIIKKYVNGIRNSIKESVESVVNEKAITISASDMDTLHKNGTVMVGDVELAFASGQNEKKVNELLADAYEMALSEVKAYEGDDNSTHTIESYMKEMAALTAEKMYEMYESACNEMREGLTAEMYESACNEMKESYAGKMDEMMKEYKKL